MWVVNVNLRKAGVIMLGCSFDCQALTIDILADSELNDG